MTYFPVLPSPRADVTDVVTRLRIITIKLSLLTAYEAKYMLVLIRVISREKATGSWYKNSNSMSLPIPKNYIMCYC